MHSGQYGINENQHVFIKMKKEGLGVGGINNIKIK